MMPKRLVRALAHDQEEETGVAVGGDRAEDIWRDGRRKLDYVWDWGGLKGRRQLASDKKADREGLGME